MSDFSWKEVGAAVREAVGLLERCARSRGSVLVAGLGKSGLVGAKIAASDEQTALHKRLQKLEQAAEADAGN